MVIKIAQKDDLTAARYLYKGKIPSGLLSSALDSYSQYKSDKETLVARIKDNEHFYRRSYEHSHTSLEASMECDTSFIFASIENTRADAVENFPTPNILERDPEGSEAAEVLSKVVPAQLDVSGFKRVYKEDVRNKLKYGTAIYGVFYNEFTENIDIKAIDILDIFVDMHIPDIQDSKFLFISAAVSNDALKRQYPEFSELFTGDATVETLTDDYVLKDRTLVLDAYYKKDGHVHMMKLVDSTIIAATEDMEGYEDGLYRHGKYPVVFDVLYPVEHCPFGFGMIDIAKSTQISINKMDRAITENIMINSKPRYMCRKGSGINEKEFSDLTKNVVHYEGDASGIQAISGVSINEYYLNHRERKKDELKELLANRDFQQGSTSGGVTAASAIQTLQEAGEKRARSMIDDSYDSYKDIVVMIIELMREFFDKPRHYRTSDEFGRKDFTEFDNSMLYTKVIPPEDETSIDPETGDIIVPDAEWRPLEFDIDVTPQRENPYSQEKMNNTILTFWQSGFMTPDNIPIAIIALKNMHFDGKEKFISDLQSFKDEYDMQQQQAQQLQAAQQQQQTAQPQAAEGSDDAMLAALQNEAAARGDTLIPLN